jgi:hypothetical protein
VPPELLDTTLSALRLAIGFVTALFLPVMLQLLLLFVAGWAFRGLAYRVSTIATLLDVIGVPIHELSHALGFLLTFCGVASIKLLIDELGYAFVVPKRSNILGRIVASLAPLFGGVLVLWLAATYVIPGFEAPTVSPRQLDLNSVASLGTVLGESMAYLERFLRTAYLNLSGLQWGSWRTYVGLYIAFSVGIGIAPSTDDLKILRAALPLAALLILGLFALLYLSGDAETVFVTLQQSLWPSLLRFSTAVTYAFVLTSLGMLIFLPLRLLQKVREG